MAKQTGYSARFLDLLRTGSWLNVERLRLWPLAVLVVTAAGLAYVIATAHGLNDFKGRPLGTDFSNVYAAGTFVLDGKPAAPFDPAEQLAREQTIFGNTTQFYGWHYPPFFLLIAAVLATMPYHVALAVWQCVTLALYLYVVNSIARRFSGAFVPPRLVLLLSLAFPSVFINLIHGQNGFLTASLLGGALIMLEDEPIFAGILFGLLAYKPQFGMMIPIALIAGAYRRAFVAAAITIIILIIVTLIAFGPDTWQAFFVSTKFARVALLEQGAAGWYRMQSVFAWVRMWTGSIALAYAMQGAVTVAVAATLGWLWRARVAYPVKAAALIIGCVLATPYSFDYDLVVLAPAIAFLAGYGLQHGFAPYEKTMIACLWFVPIFARGVAQATALPLGIVTMLAAFILILRRGRLKTASEKTCLP